MNPAVPVYDLTMTLKFEAVPAQHPAHLKAFTNQLNIPLGMLPFLGDMPEVQVSQRLAGTPPGRAPNGPRNPNRTDIGENGHKVEPSPAPKIVVDEDGA